MNRYVPHDSFAWTRRRCAAVPRLPNWRPAFTLLEMIVAGVLMALLMTAVVGVLRELLQERQRFETSHADLFPESLVRQLRRDIVNARLLRQRPTQIDLWGYGVQEPSTGQPLLTGGIVSYHIRPGTHGGLLFRSQQTWLVPTPSDLSAASFANFDLSAGWAQPVWAGVASVSLLSSWIDQSDVSLLDPAAMQSVTTEQTAAGQAWLPMPATVDVLVIGTQGQVLFRESIVRGEET
jgi:type II secretory pathway pseudopilin PulG